jgi:transcription antitermination factor nusB
MRKRIQEERMTEEKNMTRREIREQVFKMLFRVEFYNQEEMSEQIALCEDDACSWKEKDKTYIFEKVEKISEKLEEIDAKINEVSEGWKTGRMGKVDLTLIRLAVYEMLYEEDVLAKVAINEAVELAKQYGTDNSPSFVNGVLAKLV